MQTWEQAIIFYASGHEHLVMQAFYEVQNPTRSSPPTSSASLNGLVWATAVPKPPDSYGVEDEDIFRQISTLAKDIYEAQKQRDEAIAKWCLGFAYMVLLIIVYLDRRVLKEKGIPQPWLALGFTASGVMLVIGWIYLRLETTYEALTICATYWPCVLLPLLLFANGRFKRSNKETFNLESCGCLMGVFWFLGAVTFLTTMGTRLDLKEFQSVTVGNYTIHPLQATGKNAAKGLNQWLTAHKFPTMEGKHIDYYAERGWTFLIIEIKEPPQYGRLRPLHVSFAADKIYYPLKISANVGMFDASLYVITPIGKPIVKDEFGFEPVIEGEFNTSTLSAPLKKMLQKVQQHGYPQTSTLHLTKLVAPRLNSPQNRLVDWPEDFNATVEE